MSEWRGRFVWYELMTSDREAAKAFYGAVVGWGAEDTPMPDMVYTMVTVGERPVGGVMELPDQARLHGVAPRWIGYVAVESVDATAEQAIRLGATQRVPPTDIPEIGRFAVLDDPQGAPLALFRSANPDQEPNLEPDQPGGIGWHELRTKDWQVAFAFYAELFGWEKAEAMDMGEMGTYQLFSAAGQTIGGMFNQPEASWVFYFNVLDIDAAAARVTEAGGSVVQGPIAVPGGGWIVQGRDPQGATFALLGTREG